MRGAYDPVWRRFYAECARAQLQYAERRITIRELRRKLEAARRFAYTTQGGRQ